ncbi:alpha-amylase family glycosyl hydrolase [Rhodocaloribacter sp.]
MRPLLVFLLALSTGAHAQPLTDAVRLQGYAHEDGVTHFVFDAGLYGVTPERVVVTGAFRSWDANMDLPAWRLAPHPTADGVWTLAVPNEDYAAIAPATPFKFRIDDGVWLDPPAAAPNVEGGNLVFLFGVDPPALRAEIQGPKAVWAEVSGDGVARPLDAEAYRLTNARGDEIPLARVLPNTARRTLLVPAFELDWRRVYFLEIPALGLRTRVRRDSYFRTLFSDEALGANMSEDGSETTFRLFAPRADRVELYLYLYPDQSPGEADAVITMSRRPDGVWETTQPGDHHGVYYDFRVYGPNDPGNAFYDTDPVQISDPYARVSVDSFGKSRVWHRTEPAEPLSGGRPKMEDVVAYEVHVQDFTDLLPVEDALKGTIPAMVVPGLTNSLGEPVGFDYLVDLGVNVVHLMPVQEFLHYPDEEWQAAFAGDPFAIEQGIDRENYQWGYRTTHAFAVETRYRKRGTEHGAQREQFRNLVQAFHDAGLAVIIDVVPNHTGENMDGRNYLFNFNALDRPYYYRTDDALDHIGPFGNEVKTEDRPMTQRWLLDQLRHFVDEFGVDGFRIDLAGQIDEQTLRWVKAQLPDDLILYGEPWIDASDPEVRANPDWDWYKEDAPITFFQDAARDAFIGSPFRLEDKATDRGFAGGNGALREAAMRALANAYPEEAASPNRGIAYLDIHDNWTLADRFATRDWNGNEGVDAGPYKIAAGLLFTTVGPIVLHGGSEMMRSKGLAPIEEFEKATASGPIYFKGRDDTYNLRRPNEFVWENVGRSDGPNDYANMRAYWKGLIAFRMSDYGKVFRTAEPVPEGYYRWILPENDRLLGYLVDEQVLVLVNTDTGTQTFEDVALPAGTWRLIADGDRVDHEAGVEGPDASLTGDAAVTLTLPPTSLKIWVRE